jgi:hypothetical protein
MPNAQVCYDMQFCYSLHLRLLSAKTRLIPAANLRLVLSLAKIWCSEEFSLKCISKCCKLGLEEIVGFRFRLL